MSELTKGKNEIPTDVLDKIDKVCANCGSTEEIEYHHIVPVHSGGTNKPTNIVALCHACHMAVHWGGNIPEYRKTIPINYGKPRAEHIDGYETVYEAAERLGVTPRLIQSTAKAGRIEVIKISGNNYYKSDSLDYWREHKWEKGWKVDK